jgi:hypothetical protein
VHISARKRRTSAVQALACPFKIAAILADHLEETVQNLTTSAKFQKSLAILLTRLFIAAHHHGY